MQGIVHIIGPDLGYTQPGKTVVCGDSHTSTHGALGAFAVGIGTSEVEHVLATQTLRQFKPRTMEVRVGRRVAPPELPARTSSSASSGESASTAAPATSSSIPAKPIRSLSMDGRMTVCNMSIEAGARAGMIAPDETTFDYVRGRQFAPQGADFDAAVERWKQLPTDPGATFDKTEIFRRLRDGAIRDLGDQPRHGGAHQRAGARSRVPSRKPPSRKRPPGLSNTWTCNPEPRSRT